MPTLAPLRDWPPGLPQVMFKYVDICVEMKQGRKCKDALINYRNACQQVNVGSLEEVIKYLLQVASARAEEASKAAEAKLDGVEDLEAEASPEEMMLSYVSGEKSKDRTDRELVTPWFKFLWETYRWGGGGVGRGGRRSREATNRSGGDEQACGPAHVGTSVRHLQIGHAARPWLHLQVTHKQHEGVHVVVARAHAAHVHFSTKQHNARRRACA